MKAFVGEALAAAAEIDQTGEVYPQMRCMPGLSDVQKAKRRRPCTSATPRSRLAHNLNQLADFVSAERSLSYANWISTTVVLTLLA